MNTSSITSSIGIKDQMIGIPSDMFVIKNKHNMQATFTNYGARLVSLLVPDKNGNSTDVVLGFDNLLQYQTATLPYFGAVIGRYSNRIDKGRFCLDDIVYELIVNNGSNTLHGGVNGFHNVVWDVEIVETELIQFSYLSQHLEGGFPGDLFVKVSYRLTEENELEIEFWATTDRKTVVSLSNHVSFNLNGEGSGTILNHHLHINANHYTPVDRTLIPTGEIRTVLGTAFDFNVMTTIGSRICANEQQLIIARGYDHNFVLNKNSNSELSFAARAIGDLSGIQLEVFTEEPGLQFYSGNNMYGDNCLKSNQSDTFRTAFSLETQHFPDSPNHSHFPSTELDAGDCYQSTTIYKFSVSK
jgi:aldose 1-epimerase